MNKCHYWRGPDIEKGRRNSSCIIINVLNQKSNFIKITFRTFHKLLLGHIIKVRRGSVSKKVWLYDDGARDGKLRASWWIGRETHISESHIGESWNWFQAMAQDREKRYARFQVKDFEGWRV